MSTHPNVILLLSLTPDDLSRKTKRSIVSNNRLDQDSDSEDDDRIKIGDNSYYIEIMEDEYDDSWQISGNEGDIIIFSLVTYGYGEKVSWNDLEKRKNELEEWAKVTCETYHCSYQIDVTANYW